MVWNRANRDEKAKIRPAFMKHYLQELPNSSPDRKKELTDMRDKIMNNR